MVGESKSYSKYKILEIALLILTPIFLLIQTFYNSKRTLLPTIVMIIVTIIVFMLGFEKRKVSTVEMTCIVVLSVIGALLRMLSPLPHAIFTTAVVIIGGISFGESSGFITGVFVGILSNMLMGFGPWTPWQIYAWGIIGYIAGLLGKTKLFEKNIPIIIYGFISGFLYGFILNIYFVLGLSYDSVVEIINYFAASLAFEFTHALSTAIFLTLTLYPWRALIKRIKLKFGEN